MRGAQWLCVDPMADEGHGPPTVAGAAPELPRVHQHETAHRIPVSTTGQTGGHLRQRAW
jgi:hypothetical protein